MDPVTAKLMSAAGAAEAKVYVDDVFSTYLHAGENSSSTINNGIDLSGEGGLVWVKTRNSTYSHFLFDTERGTTKTIGTNLYNAEFTESKGVTAFNSNGFNIGGSGGDIGFNASGYNYCYWTFRKAPGFFDVVTWTGNGVNGRQISHSLGSVPGTIFVKRTSGISNWEVWHRSIANDEYLQLNSTNPVATGGPWNNTAPTSTHFTVSSDSDVNASSETYVAYLFAHDEQSFGTGGNESIIKCGSYAPSSNPEGATTVNLGFEPQWVLIKNITTSSQYVSWMMFDNMRGVVTGGNEEALAANTNDNEGNGVVLQSRNSIDFTSTGFIVDPANSQFLPMNSAGDTYIYMAIRRPHKPPSAGTEVFAVDNNDTGYSANTPSFISNFAVDLLIRRNQVNNSDSAEFGTRLINRIQNIVYTDSSFDAGTSVFPYNNGVYNLNNVRATDYVWMFKRASGFLDVVAYAGNSTSGRTESHNLGVVPEMMLIKARDGTRAWRVYDANTGANGSLRLNSDAAKDSNSTYWSTPTADNIILGTDNDTNSSSYNYIAYLFATLPGISKIGTFSGTGNDINVDCGFTAGVRFLLIKRTDSSGDWYLYDSLRGIVGGNDPYLRLNSTGAEVTNTDYIDPLNAGFTVTSSAPAAINTNGGTYIFLAIA